jgi:hypothetical protein
MSLEHSKREAATVHLDEVSRLQDEIRERWKRLSPELQIRMLLQLSGTSPEADWSIRFCPSRKESLSLVARELLINPRYAESYGDDEMEVEIITDETIPGANVGIEPKAGADLLAFFRDRIVTNEPIYACVERGESTFPQLVSVDWHQPIRLTWKKKEGAMGRIFRERMHPEEINSLTFLQREDGGLTVIFYWPQAFFDRDIERLTHLPASEIAALEFFISHPRYMEGREGFPNGALVQWAREHGGDARIRSFDPEFAIAILKQPDIHS